jgi:hypothetical protein
VSERQPDWTATGRTMVTVRNLVIRPDDLGWVFYVNGEERGREAVINPGDALAIGAPGLPRPAPRRGWWARLRSKFWP